MNYIKLYEQKRNEDQAESQILEGLENLDERLKQTLLSQLNSEKLMFVTSLFFVALSVKKTTWTSLKFVKLLMK